MKATTPQCQSCGKKQAVYRIVRINAAGSDYHCCTACWKKMKMAAHPDRDDLHDQLLSSLMKAAPRVTDRESKTVREHLIEAISAKMRMIASPEFMDKIREIADVMITCLRRDGTIYTCGSGSCAGEARHLVSELVGRYKLSVRRGLPAVHLVSCPSLLDDFSHGDIFVRQVEALVTERDVLVGVSANGNSPCVVRALQKASEQGAFAIGLTGGDGGAMLDATRLSLVVPSTQSQTIQECQTTGVHILCDLIEQALCGGSDGAEPIMV